MEKSEQQELKEKIRELEKKISELRASRRVLLNLLESSTREKMIQIVHLEKEVHNLRRRNQKFAKELLHIQRCSVSVSKCDERLDPL